jgi:hypothetical protein
MEKPSAGAWSECGNTLTGVPHPVRKVLPSNIRDGINTSATTRSALTPWKLPKTPHERSTAADRSRRLSCSALA